MRMRSPWLFAALLIQTSECMLLAQSPRPVQRYRRALDRVGREWEHAAIGVAGMQSALLGGTADAASQQLMWHSVDQSHVAAMAILAACLSGALNAMWLKRLEATVPGTSAGAVLQKTLLDYVCAGTIANSAYLVLVPLLTAALAGDVVPASGAELLAGWTPEGFRSVMVLEACTFAPYNLLAFRCVPPELRPLTAAGVSATCTIVLSGITLGLGS
tara:strand:- start:42 stop:689 length:648 start_codon:yes stop_codon:yes gene_type:complete